MSVQKCFLIQKNASLLENYQLLILSPFSPQTLLNVWQDFLFYFPCFLIFRFFISLSFWILGNYVTPLFHFTKLFLPLDLQFNLTTFFISRSYTCFFQIHVTYFHNILVWKLIPFRFLIISNTFIVFTFRLRVLIPFATNSHFGAVSWSPAIFYCELTFSKECFFCKIPVT